METISLDTDIVYIFALGLLREVGPQKHRKLVLSFPTAQDFQRATREDINQILGPSLASSIYSQVHQSPENWTALLKKSQELLQEHIQVGIHPIPMTSASYPKLLKYISDPPVILYAKGDTSLLQQAQTVAIVGTREPTPKGENVARHLARFFAQARYCVVSGLAKGIDTAAHEGALEGQGKTIAIFGTPLDQVYPAANKHLAQRILDAGGLLLSELPLGQKGFRSAFVQRDRIQSGLSLAVIPVQTGLDGGTMHTVQFAKMQNRLVACPVPLEPEKYASQYEGIRALIKEKSTVYSFKAGSVERSDILHLLEGIKQYLLMSLGQEDTQTRERMATSALLLDHVREVLQAKLASKPQSSSSSTEEETFPASQTEDSSPQRSAEGKDEESWAESFYKPSENPLRKRVAEPEGLYESSLDATQASLW